MHATLTAHDELTDTPSTRGAGNPSGGQIAITFGDPMTDRSYVSVTMSGTRLTLPQHQLIARMARAYPDQRIVVTCHHDRLGADWAPTALCDDVVDAVGRPPDFRYWGYAHLGVTFAGVVGCRSHR
ncbi:MAG: hypothetical protein JWM12_1730 [Ilumatobacteraceae bacterium]|nr:hypothetical protein [Ilumatobacteraceae bacterium]